MVHYYVGFPVKGMDLQHFLNEKFTASAKNKPTDQKHTHTHSHTLTQHQQLSTPLIS